MAEIRLFKMHRPWEDWLSMLLGVLIGLAPWLAGQQDHRALMWNAIIVGVLVIMLGALELVSLQRWEEIGEIACGLWLIASPYIFSYGGTLATWHFGLGAAVAVLAAVELWQDWRLGDKEMAAHGQ